jgi:hypothetical protein
MISNILWGTKGKSSQNQIFTSSKNNKDTQLATHGVHKSNIPSQNFPVSAL